MSAISWDSACGSSKGCFPNCPDGCDYLVTWTDTGSNIQFTLQAEESDTSVYLAIGFSDDRRMVCKIPPMLNSKPTSCILWLLGNVALEKNPFGVYLLGLHRYILNARTFNISSCYRSNVNVGLFALVS